MQGKWAHFGSTMLMGTAGVLLLYAYLLGGLPLGSGSGLGAMKQMGLNLLVKPGIVTLILGLLLSGIAIYSGWQLKGKKPAASVSDEVPGSKVSDADSLSADRLQRLVALARSRTDEGREPIYTPPSPPLAPVMAAQPAVGVAPDAGMSGETKEDVEPVAPPRGEIDPVVRQSAQQAVLFRQHVPPRFDTGATSWFGGEPLGQSDFVWPMTQYADQPNRPMAFVMQVDCAAIPAEARLGLMPGHGLLQLFMDLSSWGNGHGFAVKWIDAVPSQMMIAPAPDEMSPVYGEEARFDHIWAKHAPDPEQFADRLLPRWTFDPVMVKLPPEAFAGQVADWRLDYPGEEPLHLIWPGWDVVQDAILAAQGYDVAKPGDDPDQPFDSFPHDWRAMQIAAGHVLGQLKERYSNITKTHFPNVSEEERAALEETVIAEASQWFAMASAHAPFDAVDAETAAAMRSWLAERNWAANLGFARDVILESAEASLSESPDAAARVPEALLPHISYRRALAIQSGSGLFVRDNPRMLSAASGVQTVQEDMAPTHILLFELSSHEGLGHRFGEGVFQFWITPDDLAARHFDKVVLTTEAY